MATMVSDLPSKLMEEILSRVPLKFMRAVRSTCRKWNSVSKSQSFTKKHISKVTQAATREGESQMVTMTDYKLSLHSVILEHLNHPSTELKGRLNEQVEISQVYHCEGLLLCVLKGSLNLVVWNPYWGKTNWVECRYFHSFDGMDRFNYALGYEVETSGGHSHKILRFAELGQLGTGDHFFWYEIYDFGSGSWKTLDVTPNCAIMFHQRGVSLNGNTYWCASERAYQDGVDDHIISFDFTSERFGPLLRLPFDAGVNDYVNLSCVREEKLAVLVRHNEVNPYEIDIWITTKIEAEEMLWSKFLTVDLKPINAGPPSSKGFFIDEEKKVVMGFEDYYYNTFQIIGEAGYYKELDLGERALIECTREVYSYVPSLVQIKQLPRGKKRQLSEIEKLKYDENMSRVVELEKQSALGGRRRNRN